MKGYQGKAIEIEDSSVSNSTLTSMNPNHEGWASQFNIKATKSTTLNLPTTHKGYNIECPVDMALRRGTHQQGCNKPCY